MLAMMNTVDVIMKCADDYDLLWVTLAGVMQSYRVHPVYSMVESKQSIVDKL